MKHSEILFGVLRLPVDWTLAFLGLMLAYWLRSANIDLLPMLHQLASPSNLPPQDYYIQSFALPAAFVYIAILACMQLYVMKITIGPWREMIRVGAATLLWLAAVIAWFFLVQKQLFFSRALLLQATIFIALFTVTGRAAILLVQRALLRRGIGVRTVISCGAAPLSLVVTQTLKYDRRFRFVGHKTTQSAVIETQSESPIDLVLHTDPNPGSAETAALIDFCRSHHIGYAFLPPVFADVPHQLAIEKLGLTPMLRFEPTPLDGWGRVGKRLMDLVLGIILLIVLGPVMQFVFFLILLTSGWPVFYVSRRVGQYGRGTVPIVKFRTMVRDADTQKPNIAHLSHRTDGPLFKIKNDPRVTPVGRILRRFSIDELPQLMNVVLGHVSLVGPRPHLPEEVARYSPSERRVFTVRPVSPALRRSQDGRT